MSVFEAADQKLVIPNYELFGKEDLSFPVIAGREGIGITYTTKLTYRQCADNIDIEDTNIPERERLQRLTEVRRVKGIYDYLLSRDNTIFPSICLVVTDLEVNSIKANGVNFSYATLKAKASRLAIDGQGRLLSIKEILDVRPELADHYLDTKIVVVPTKTIRESATFIRQIFSDFHLALSKPNTSQNIYFDTAQPLSRLTKEIIDICAKKGCAFGGAIAVDGKIKPGQLFNLANLSEFVSIMTGQPKRALNKFLNEESNYNLYLTLIVTYIEALYQYLDFAAIQKLEAKEWKNSIDANVLTCAIGFKALAYVGRSLIESFLSEDDDIDCLETFKLSALNQLPLANKKDKLWLNKQIYQSIENKLTIVKGSEKRLASILCRKAKILTCDELI